jgi:hypothetical protein
MTEVVVCEVELELELEVEVEMEVEVEVEVEVSVRSLGSNVSGKVNGNCAKSELKEDEITGSFQYGEMEHAAVVSVAESEPEHPLVVEQVVLQDSKLVDEAVTVLQIVEQVEKVLVVHSSEDELVLVDCEFVSSGSFPSLPSMVCASS